MHKTSKINVVLDGPKGSLSLPYAALPRSLFLRLSPQQTWADMTYTVAACNVGTHAAVWFLLRVSIAQRVTGGRSDSSTVQLVTQPGGNQGFGGYLQAGRTMTASFSGSAWVRLGWGAGGEEAVSRSTEATRTTRGYRIPGPTLGLCSIYIMFLDSREWLNK